MEVAQPKNQEDSRAFMQAFMEGAAAYRNKIARSENPYEDDAKGHWDKGWMGQFSFVVNERRRVFLLHCRDILKIEISPKGMEANEIKEMAERIEKLLATE